MTWSPDQIDELDLKIISHLQEDGRRSFREIADDVGVAERTVRLRVAQLREHNVLQIVGVVNPIKAGLQFVTIIQLSILGPQLEACIQALQKAPQIRFITLTSGEYQLLIQVVTKSHRHFLEVESNILRQIDGIRKMNVIVEMDVLKNEFRLVRDNQLI
ncbi:Lrp/AsnC family transcriptional regulator [Alicyclobacillus sp. SO9]|uniref:Lrp/AsnC family transcriptional regulator n=1 Tax=Alicyclobacillus sp. SO9 TaxID=2665646 RepID=UPI0018E82029|nr:Lrp/AsnC family transcriptional regulator [Alicyclobacillus sp. SO9]QQE80170.1 Lrp/AsnC family transcriptional regulator [Alicyclobacillus sp. SO9]